MNDDAAIDRDHGASVLQNDVAWPDNVEDDGQRKTAVLTGVSHMRRKKPKNLSSDNASTNGDHGAFILRGDVAWPDHVENDQQRETALGLGRQLPKAKIAKKIE